MIISSVYFFTFSRAVAAARRTMWKRNLPCCGRRHLLVVLICDLWFCFESTKVVKYQNIGAKFLNFSTLASSKTSLESDNLARWVLNCSKISQTPVFVTNGPEGACACKWSCCLLSRLVIFYDCTIRVGCDLQNTDSTFRVCLAKLYKLYSKEFFIGFYIFP
jgi:hypothetical protein